MSQPCQMQGNQLRPASGFQKEDHRCLQNQPRVIMIRIMWAQNPPPQNEWKAQCRLDCNPAYLFFSYRFQRQHIFLCSSASRGFLPNLIKSSPGHNTLSSSCRPQRPREASRLRFKYILPQRRLEARKGNLSLGYNMDAELCAMVKGGSAQVAQKKRHLCWFSKSWAKQGS